MNRQPDNHRVLILRAILLTLLVAAFLGLAPRGKATPDAVVTMVYWTETTTGKILRGNADGSGSAQTCVNGQDNPRGLVIANSLGKMYWIERNAGRLRRANLDCPATGVETIGPALSNADRLALDLAGGKIYWTENVGINRIRRADLNGDNAETVLSGLSEPVGVAVGHIGANDYLYWTEFTTDQVWRSSLTGANKQKLLQLTTGTNPLDIVLDVGQNRMYWTSGSLGKIYSATLEGGGAGVWRSLSEPRSIAIDVEGDKLYWADQGTDEIRRGNLDLSSNELLFNAADGVNRSLGVALLTGGASPCYSLSRTHSGQGSDPVASPGSSSGCGANNYTAGQSITLTASPAAGWRVAGWSGTNNDGSTATTNTVTMPTGAYTVSVIYEEIPVLCYTLTRTNSGQGNNPIASPAFSTGCGTGQYKAGQSITLTASAAANWHIAGWSGTNNDVSTSPTNTVTMPAGNHTVSVAYEENPVDCHTLTRTHSGQGNDPLASPAFSAGCGTGQYTAGQSITLTASPAAGWRVTGWSGTNNNANTSTVNTATMPAGDHTISVTYENVPPPCYALNRSHTGEGNDPIASPPHSTGCGTGQYTAGQSITLTASPAAGRRVIGWSGTNNDNSTSTTNDVIMPSGTHSVSVAYGPVPAGFTFYVPYVLYTQAEPPPCFAGPAEREPNNNAGEANGPLCAAGTYNGLPNDGQDYFMFDTSVPGPIAVTITGHQGEGVQLQLYYGAVAGDPVEEDLDQKDGLSISRANGSPGRYYILIYTAKPKPAENRPYTMQVVFP